MSSIDFTLPLIVVVALLIIPLGVDWPKRIAVSAAIITTIPIAPFVASRTPGDWAMTARSLVRTLMVVIITAVVPSLWPAAALYLGVTAGATSAVFPKPQGLYLCGFGTIGLALTGWAGDVTGWIAGLVVLNIMVYAIRAWAADWRKQRGEADQRFDDLIETARMFFWEVDPESGSVVSVTGNTFDMLGYHPHELAMAHWAQLIATEDEAHFPEARADAEQAGEERFEVTAVLEHRDGSAVTTRQLIRTTPKGTLVGAAVDITELSRATDALRVQAEQDALTGLANRFLFVSTLDRQFDELADADSQTSSIALILFDLDRFKGINDTLGHGLGDQVLMLLAERLRNSLGPVELVARTGGDEFAVILAGDIDRARATEVAERVAQLVEEPFPLAGLRLSVGCSVGIAIAPEHAISGEQLLQHADIALYQAKGSNQKVSVYASTPDEISVERLQLSTDIARALDQGEFELWFQPKVDLRTGRASGVEGLARWRHPRLGVLAPNRFLPLLGVSGDYQRFTDQMVEQGIEFAGGCHRAGQLLDVAVNLGTVSFLDTDLPARIATLLEIHQVPAEYLILEVTEDELLLDRDSSSAVFAELEEMGVRLSIDDFGTGYSSLSRLRGLQIQEVKIDRSFVSGLGTDPEDWAIVRTIIEMAGMLGKVTVAEGIETVEQLAILRSLGCPIGQGFLFDKALPAEGLRAEIAKGLDYSAKVLDESTMPWFPGHDLGDAVTPSWMRDGIRLPSAVPDIRNHLVTDAGRVDLLVALIELLPVAAWVKDSQARYLRANAMLRHRLGVDKPDDVVGMTDFDLHEPANAHHFIAEDMQVLSTGQPVIGKVEHHELPGGARKTIRVTKVPVWNSKDEVVGLIGCYAETEPTLSAPDGTLTEQPAGL